MSVKVKLRDVTDAMEAGVEEFGHYLDTRTGEVFLITNEDMEAAEEDEPLSKFPDWQQEAILKAREILESDHFVELPTQVDIHEYKLVEDFCLAFEDRQVGEELLRLIKGTGAFGRFKHAIQSMGVEKAWYEYRQAQIETLAIAWLEQEGIGYTHDDALDASAELM